MQKIYETEYGLKFRLLKEAPESCLNNRWKPYDLIVSVAHENQYGCIIVDAEYGTPIDNDYDLEVIAGMLKDIRADLEDGADE